MPQPVKSQHTLTVNNMNLYYEILGAGAPLLILHGYTGSGASLVEPFATLANEYQLIIPDLRGHGRSTNHADTFTFRQAASDILALLDHLNINRCAAIGFSGGGCTLLHMAHEQPERITSMVLVSAAPYFPTEVQTIMKHYAAQKPTPEQWTALRSMHVHGDAQIQFLIDQTAIFCTNNDMDFNAEKLGRIKTKTLIVQGDRDPIYPINLTIELYKGLPNASLWIIPNAGHGPISLETPQAFIETVKPYL